MAGLGSIDQFQQSPVINISKQMASKGSIGGELVSNQLTSAEQLSDATKLEPMVGTSGYSNGHYDRIEQKNPIVGLSGIDFGSLSNEDLHAYLSGALNSNPTSLADKKKATGY